MIFVDTSFWAALGNAGDARHGTAKRLWASKPPVVMTSNHVLGETWTLLNRRCGHRAAVAAAAIRLSTVVRVEHVTADLEEQALGMACTPRRARVLVRRCHELRGDAKERHPKCVCLRW